MDTHYLSIYKHFDILNIFEAMLSSVYQVR